MLLNEITLSKSKRNCFIKEIYFKFKSGLGHYKSKLHLIPEREEISDAKETELG